jgi:hypothetical protein
MIRATREGWPLLTIEAEVNGDSGSTYERDPSLIGFWACSAGTGDLCPALAALVGPGSKYFFPYNTLSILLSPLSSKLDRQPCWVTCLL